MNYVIVNQGAETLYVLAIEETLDLKAMAERFLETKRLKKELSAFNHGRLHPIAAFDFVTRVRHANEFARYLLKLGAAQAIPHFDVWNDP